MTTTAPDTPAAESPKPEELTDHQIRRLRLASGWARFLSVIGFIATGLMALWFVGMTVARLVRGPGAGVSPLAAVFAPLLVALAGVCGASILLWSYGRNIVSFFSHGEPALQRAFRSLRHFVKLWTLVLALMTALKIVAVVGRML
jgi:hypothetical protein